MSISQADRSSINQFASQHMTTRTTTVVAITASGCLMLASLWGWWAFRITLELERLAEMPGVDELFARRVASLGAILAWEFPIAVAAVIVAAVACIPRYERRWALVALGLSIGNIVLRFAVM